MNVNTLNHVFKRTLEHHGMPHIPFHDLRHSTANIYAHVDAEMKRSTASKINELFKAV